MLEEDALNMLKFMSSNGLVTNESKTAFILQNMKGEAAKDGVEINIVQSKVKSQHSAKLLGMKTQSDMCWTEHIHGRGGVISSLNQRLFTIMRLNNSLNKKSLVKVADSLFNSKIRYGLQLLGKVKMSNSETQNQDLQAIQLVQNKMIRFLNSKKISDKIKTETLITNVNMLSVNRMNAQIKLTEIWKAINLSGTPLNISVPTNDPNARGSRSTTNGRLQICKGKSTLSQSSFLNDGKRVWNAAPETIGKCSTLQSAKAEIKKYVKTLPL